MRHYRNAPITHATIELTVRLPDGVEASKFHDFVKPGDDEFPERGEIRKATIEAEFEFRKEVGTAAVMHQPMGWAFRSPDAKRIVQVRTNGFSFTRLAPYNDWAAFRNEARSLWSRYRVACEPEAIIQLSLKYVNQFNLPLPVEDFKRYFRTFPDISTDVPQELAGMFMQLQIPIPAAKSMLVVTQTIVPPPQAGVVSVVLDLQLNRSVHEQMQEEPIWQTFDTLRDEKNKAFEACISDAVREVIS